jgi:hypothetical protein
MTQALVVEVAIHAHRQKAHQQHDPENQPGTLEARAHTRVIVGRNGVRFRARDVIAVVGAA